VQPNLFKSMWQLLPTKWRARKDEFVFFVASNVEVEYNAFFSGGRRPSATKRWSPVRGLLGVAFLYRLFLPSQWMSCMSLLSAPTLAAPRLVDRAGLWY